MAGNVVVMRRARAARLEVVKGGEGQEHPSADRYRGDEIAAALGEAVSEVLLNDFGAERARRHGRVLIERVRERLGI